MCVGSGVVVASRTRPSVYSVEGLLVVAERGEGVLLVKQQSNAGKRRFDGKKKGSARRSCVHFSFFVSLSSSWTPACSPSV